MERVLLLAVAMGEADTLTLLRCDEWEDLDLARVGERQPDGVFVLRDLFREEVRDSRPSLERDRLTLLGFPR